MKEATPIIKLAIKKGLTIGTIESMTGGMLAAALTAVPGASKTFVGGFITYNDFVKQALLGISKPDIEKDGAISMNTAKNMARLGRIKLSSAIALAITGNAGPKPQEGKPNGLCFIAVSDEIDTIAHEFHFEGTRRKIRLQAVAAALKLLHQAIESKQ